MALSPEEHQRYGRQMALPEIGIQGQEKLKSARVLLVGAGGLGSPAAIYLAAAGVGTLGVIDPDRVERHNLHRQVLHPTGNIGRQKVDSARETIERLNPHVAVRPLAERLNAGNALKILPDYDLVIDGTDNFPARYLINDACVMLQKPFVYGGILRFEGQCSFFGLPDGPCYRCLFEDPPAPGEVPSCAEAGVVGVLPGIIGLLQSNEAIKYLCGIGDLLKGRLLIFDALATRFREVKLTQNKNCAICGPNPTIRQLKEYARPACPQSQDADNAAVSPEELFKKLKEQPSCLLVDVREDHEWATSHFRDALHRPLSQFPQNCTDIPRDRAVYVYCQMGGRSSQAVQHFRANGYNNVFTLSGGLQAWAEKYAANPEGKKLITSGSESS